MKNKIKNRYVASYKVGGEKYHSDIMAYSQKQAEEFALIRNIGETIEGKSNGVIDGYSRKVPEELYNPDFKKLTDYDFIISLPKIIHSSCFLGFIAIESGIIQSKDILGDKGIIHELIHLMDGEDITTRQVRRVRGKFHNLQRMIPGAF